MKNINSLKYFRSYNSLSLLTYQISILMLQKIDFMLGAQQVLQGEVVKQFLQRICFPLQEQLLQYYPIWLRMYGKTPRFSIPWKMVQLLNLFSNQDGQLPNETWLAFPTKEIDFWEKILQVYLQTSDASLASKLCEMCAANNNVDTLHRIFITSQAEVLPSLEAR